MTTQLPLRTPSSEAVGHLAHGFLFQHHTEFATDVHAFLDEVD